MEKIKCRATENGTTKEMEEQLRTHADKLIQSLGAICNSDACTNALLKHLEKFLVEFDASFCDVIAEAHARLIPGGNTRSLH